MSFFLKILKGEFLSGYKTYILLIVPSALLVLNWAVGVDVTGAGLPVLDGAALASALWKVAVGATIRKGIG